MSYCKNVKFEEKPDYNKLIQFMNTLFEKKEFERDYQYDWIVRKNSMNRGNSQRHRDNGRISGLKGGIK